MLLARVTKSVSVVMAALVVSACGGLGDGSKPESLEIRRVATSVLLGTNSNKAFVCFPDQLQVVATATDGHLGDFTSRVIWTSSNPDVVAVSNGDIQLPDDATKAYAAGVLIPKAAGTATITAKFSKLSTTYEVVVDEPSSISIEPTSQSLALYSTSLIKVYTVVDGYKRDVTAKATWKIVEADTDTTSTDIGTVGATTGAVAANKTLGTLHAKATLSACPEGSALADTAANLLSTINVRALTSLTVTREFGDTPPALTLGTTEALTLTGHFSGTSETQDLSTQAAYTSTSTAIAGSTSPANLILAASVGSVQITPRYPPTDRTDFTTISATPLTVETADRTFTSFVITPATTTVGPFVEKQFHAIATYGDGVTQDITRHVAWALAEGSSDEDLALVSIGTTYSLAGLAIARQIDDGEVTIAAKRGTGDTAVTQTATLTVDAP